MTKRITVDLTLEEYEAFVTKCFLAKPRLRHNAAAVALIRVWCGLDKSHVADPAPGGKKTRK